MVANYRAFIPDSSGIAELLNSTLNLGQPLNFEPSQEIKEACENLKEKLTFFQFEYIHISITVCCENGCVNYQSCSSTYAIN